MRDDSLWLDVRGPFAKGRRSGASGAILAQYPGDPRMADWIRRVNRPGEIRNRAFYVEEVARR